MKRPDKPTPPPFEIRKQHIERYYLTGTQDHIGEAIEWCTQHKLFLSTVGPKMLGRTNQAKDEGRFILLAEKVVK